MLALVVLGLFVGPPLLILLASIGQAAAGMGRPTEAPTAAPSSPAGTGSQRLGPNGRSTTITLGTGLPRR